MIFCFIYRHRLKSITFALSYYHRNQIICGENKKNLSQLVTLNNQVGKNVALERAYEQKLRLPQEQG
jgi:hypothetical protein